MAIQRERREQEMLVSWFRLQYPHVLIAASANGGARNPREAANMKREGVCAGWPDIQVAKACRGFHGLFIELKAPKTDTQRAGSVSVKQKIVLLKLHEEDYCAKVCYGWLEAKGLIRWYLDD